MSRIQRAFSAGTLGRRGRRKLVPTRWSITAVDDLLGKANLDRIRYLPELSEILVYSYTALDNRWLLIFLPGCYRYESIEAWYPNTLWNPSSENIVMAGDHEGFHGRTTYASIGGCYYAARLATSEMLLRVGRQAGHARATRSASGGDSSPGGVERSRARTSRAHRGPRTVGQPRRTFPTDQRGLRHSAPAMAPPKCVAPRGAHATPIGPIRLLAPAATAHRGYVNAVPQFPQNVSPGCANCWQRGQLRSAPGESHNPGRTCRPASRGRRIVDNARTPPCARQRRLQNRESVESDPSPPPLGELVGGSVSKRPPIRRRSLQR